ncbi:MAG: DNA polymerase III subunit gamma/tau [Magnetococcales bacterium]|nr:DNA polymerase III subunit gamma/tau [Magnetococcales bacterium]
MSNHYVVLARRWRPRSFDTLIGQDHVTRALTHALDHDRLSHAFLFSGIRGTGKTTLARLLALCLNCEQGTSSKPCGRCGSCTEIIAGNHPDVLEVDAASRTKVDQMRELLDMVAYAPTHSRFRIFILDEVHMLSAPSFNALLKTLEEPPNHVKFLFATTELRKLPATILSRCQRYELKRVPESMLVSHMSHILEQESITFEKNALELVARAAEGSVRDALSLLDQVISHGNGTVAHATVGQLLGLTHGETTRMLLNHVLTGEGKTLLETLSILHQSGVEPESVVRDLLDQLHLEVRTRVTRGTRTDVGDAPTPMPRSVSLEHLQMVYMVLNKGGHELRLTAHPWHAMEMLMLRACFLAPVPDLDRLIRMLEKNPAQGGGNSGHRSDPATSSHTASTPNAISSSPSPMAPIDRRSSVSSMEPSDAGVTITRKTDRFPDDWDHLIAYARGKQPALAMKLNTQLACLRYQPPTGQQAGCIELQLINDCFGTPDAICDSVAGLIRQCFHEEINVSVKTSSDVNRPATLLEKKRSEQEASLNQLEKELQNHPGLQSLRTRFDAEILSVMPVESRNIH